MIEAPLTLVFKIGQWASHLLFFFKGAQYFVYDCLQPVTTQITQHTQPTIVDTSLTLIVKIGLGG